MLVWLGWLAYNDNLKVVQRFKNVVQKFKKRSRNLSVQLTYLLNRLWQSLWEISFVNPYFQIRSCKWRPRGFDDLTGHSFCRDGRGFSRRWVAAYSCCDPVSSKNELSPEVCAHELVTLRVRSVSVIAWHASSTVVGGNFAIVGGKTAIVGGKNAKFQMTHFANHGCRFGKSAL